METDDPERPTGQEPFYGRRKTTFRRFVFFGSVFITNLACCAWLADLFWRMGFQKAHYPVMAVFIVLNGLLTLGSFHALFGFFAGWTGRKGKAARIMSLADGVEGPLKKRHAVVMPVYNEDSVKTCARIEAIHRIPEIMRRAFAVATSGRPGPVIVDVPEDIAHGMHGFEDGDFEVDPAHEAAPALRCRPDAASLARAADMIADAERPILLCGGGIHISQATGAVTRFAEANGIPVAHTMSGKGAIACTSPLSAGLFGRYDRIANDLIAKSDCIIVAGCKLGEIATKRFTIPQKGQRVIHLDNVAEEMGRTYEPTVKLWGDAREGLDDLTARLAERSDEQRARRAGYLAEIPAKMQKWHDEVAAERLYSDETPVNMARLITELNNHLPEDGHLIADGGFAAHWGGLLFNSKRARRTFVPDRGFASIGYGLPGAMGAQLAAPEATVVGLTGDGGFNMVLGELETARRMKLGLTVIVVNNAASGYVKALQHLMYGEGKYQSSDLAETNYAKLAEAMGCHGIRVEEPGALADALKAAFAEKERPSVIDVMVTRDPSKMLPAVDNRTVQVKKGDRVA